MEDFKDLREIVNFVFVVILLLLFCLLIYKFSKQVDSKIELNKKEDAYMDLKIQNEKKYSVILDKKLEQLKEE
ncbi:MULTISPECIES: hypothetical protein [Arcobacteraceae]|uniref:hypothetical protein n=1 Tax=Arcobacteraceae TaxID=2808963 RepID=UPI001EDBC416|nr:MULTISPECIES: hypothetical protein [Arcobacteraceae]MCG3683689.1 hypothetical protein [Aliarcobacter butzleri]MCT7643438.1 hypothetical protein [Aliarcobacter butzleri]MCT7908760.1 hypothetical protein [Arcobacter lacus]